MRLRCPKSVSLLSDVSISPAFIFATAFFLCLLVTLGACTHRQSRTDSDSSSNRGYSSYPESSSATDPSSQSQITSILYTCSVSFRANGQGIYIVGGYTHIPGSGEITCLDLLTGARERIPIRVTASGPGIGLGYTSLSLSGVATGIGLTTGPESLLGNYVQLRANAAVGLGVGAGTGLKFSKGAVLIDVQVDFQSGIGAGIDLLVVKIERDPSREPYREYVPLERAQNVPPERAQNVRPTSSVSVRNGERITVVDADGNVIQTLVIKIQ